MGALEADLSAVVRINISERYLPDSGRCFYIVHDPAGSYRVETKNEAIERAVRAGEEAARAEARMRGAEGEIPVSSRVEHMKVTNNAGKKFDIACCVICEAAVSFA